MHTEVQIIVNGKALAVPSATHLQTLIELLGVQGKRIALELNREIVPKSQYATTCLQPNDQIEIVQAIGGG